MVDPIEIGNSSMKSNSTSKTLSIEVSNVELWYLAQYFGPGWVFGIENPTENLSDEEKYNFEKEAQTSLSKDGLISMNGGNQIQVDEMLGGMAYSLVHSEDILVVHNIQNGKEAFFHFLPQWQMELIKTDEGYEMTLFKEKKDLFEHILFSQSIKLSEFNINNKFSIASRELELAAFMYESGKKEKALENFKSNGFGELPSEPNFLAGYLTPEFHLIFDMLHHRNDQKRIHSTTNELIQINSTLYWVSHDEAGEEATEMMNFTSITPSQAERRFFRLLPKN